MDDRQAEANRRFVGRFQAATGLQVDEWAGPATHEALTRLLLDAEQATAPSPLSPCSASVLNRLTPQLVKSTFPRATPLSNITQYLPPVKCALREAGLVDAPMVAMALATIRAETEGFAPIEEGVSKYNTDPGAHPFNRYDDRKDLGNRGRPDGVSYKGRGLIQLTGRDNYEKYGKKLGIDLVRNPEMALRPDVSAHLLARFLADKQQEIREALERGDMRKARRLVNGGSHGLNRFVDTYKRAMAALA
jgi:peptidoglycan L-alanyl-D-glutamate endopeptidase CwlK